MVETEGAQQRGEERVVERAPCGLRRRAQVGKLDVESHESP
jgi:hypothetical protein